MSTKKSKKLPTFPQPVFTDTRICFAIGYYASEKDAMQADKAVRARGYTYNGGFFHGMACGRDREWDYVKDGVQYYAVTM